MTDPNSLDFTVPDPWGDLPAYALNALSPDERARVDALLESSPEAKDALRRYMEAVENLSVLAGEAQPDERVRTLVLAQADSDIHLMEIARKEAKSVEPAHDPFLRAVLKPARMAYAGTTAALISVISIAVIFGIENSQLNSEVEQLRSDVHAEFEAVSALRASLEETKSQFALQDAEIARLTAVNAGLNEAVKHQQWLTYVTQNRDYRVPAYLIGGNDAPEANGTLAVKNFGDEAVLLVSGLPQAPEAYQYILSLVRDGVSESVATFQVNEAGMARVEFQLPDNIVQYERAAVTLEEIESNAQSVSGPEVMIASESRP